MIIFNEINNISYVSAGIFMNDKEWMHAERIIDTYEIIFMVKGEVYIEENGIQYELKKGDILLLEPAKKHRGFKTSQNPCGFYWLHFYLNDKKKINFKYLNINDTIQADNITYYFSQILSVSNSSFYSNDTVDALSLIMICYLNVAFEKKIDNSSRLINEIIEYIRINATLNITVQNISKYYGYNPDYLSLLFKNKTGIGLKEYISKTKLNYAKNLLVSSAYSIKEIATILNFNSTQHFIVFFKYYENVSPLKYKNRNIGTHLNNK